MDIYLQFKPNHTPSFYLSCAIVGNACLSPLFMQNELIKAIARAILAGITYCANFFYIGYYPQLANHCYFTPLKNKPLDQNRFKHEIDFKNRIIYTVISAVHIGWKFGLLFGLPIALSSQAPLPFFKTCSRTSLSKVSRITSIFFSALFAFAYLTRSPENKKSFLGQQIETMKNPPLDSEISEFDIIQCLLFMRKFKKNDCKIFSNEKLPENLETQLSIAEDYLSSQETTQDTLAPTTSSEVVKKYDVNNAKTLYQNAYTLKKNELVKQCVEGYKAINNQPKTQLKIAVDNYILKDLYQEKAKNQLYAKEYKNMSETSGAGAVILSLILSVYFITIRALSKTTSE